MYLTCDRCCGTGARLYLDTYITRVDDTPPGPGPRWAYP